MPPVEKNRIMSDFASGHIDVIVSTTVIEVGVDVPNATVMVVENAERFGLAQLHQLRGRVGRGEAQSYCVFISSQTGEETMKRLEILNQSNDGFHIASEDLRLRGAGDIFGVRQSGLLEFPLADIYQDAAVLQEAAAAAEAVLARDPELTEAENEGLRGYLENDHAKLLTF
jgi:ATP-dependent DNA helicase RecG